MSFLQDAIKRHFKSKVKKQDIRLRSLTFLIPPALKNLLKKGAVVIHCGGPFQYTAKAMADACLETKTHYTDITGEHQVFELLAGYDQKGKAAGIMIMPGTGFDVVPSDCLALHLKNRLPSATHLQLAFTMSKGRSVPRYIKNND